MIRYNRVFILAFVFIGVFSCSKLDYTPKDVVSTDEAIVNLTTATAALNGLYDELQDETLAFDGYLSMWQYFSDEADWTGTFPTRAEFDALNVFPANTTMAAVYSDYYDVINYANYLIEELPLVDAPDFPADVLNDFLGAVHFVRALMYFYIHQGWGTSPLVLTATRPDAVGEELFVRNATPNDIADQIISDLTFAEQNAGNSQNFFASSNAAKALLSRVHLYLGNYDLALEKAEDIIPSYPLEGDFRAVFSESSAENIFLLKYNQNDQNSNAFFYFPAALGGRLSISPSGALINSYEPGDLRFAATIDTVRFHGIKYQDIANGSDPIYFLRAGEIYLNAAEAAAETGDFDLANNYYNAVRARAGLPAQTLDANNYVDLLLQERFVELALESGHRLWDLRRRGRAAEVLGEDYGDPCDEIWPIPQRDIDRNPNLVQLPCCNC